VPPPRLETERLALTPLPARAAAALPEDREAAARHLTAPLDAEWPGPDLLGVLHRQAAASPETERFGIWVIVERDGGSVVGDVGFHGPPDGTGAVEIGYSVVPSRRRRGYATEATSALVEWAASQPGVNDVVAGCAPDNLASIRTLERVGFVRAGAAKGEVRWRYGGVRGADRPG
jgi:ribosomal-protein-alanine N-acetyltransferase